MMTMSFSHVNVFSIETQTIEQRGPIAFDDVTFALPDSDCSFLRRIMSAPKSFIYYISIQFGRTSFEYDHIFFFLRFKNWKISLQHFEIDRL